jgi:cytochrome c peroxidase
MRPSNPLRIRVYSVLAVVFAVGSAAPLALGAGGPPSRPKPEERAIVELGRRLFFDPVASRSGMRSCAACHDPMHGFSDSRKLSLDARGSTTRHTQTLVDCADSPSMDWDGQLHKISDVVRARISLPRTRTSPQERPAPVYYKPAPPVTPSDVFVSALVPDTALPLPHEAMSAAGRYRSAFEAVFGAGEPTHERIVQALTAYCRTIRSGESAYDRFAAGDQSALNESARRGLDLFQGRAGCVRCHSMEGPRPKFTDYGMHRIDLSSVRPGSAGLALAKTPTLRDVAERGPYMHDGSIKTLDAAVRFFFGWGEDGKAPASIEQDVSDVVEFLRALTSDERPGKAQVAWSHRVRQTRLRFVDANDKPLANWPVTLAPAGDAMPGSDTLAPLRLVTDAEGYVAYAPPPTTHARIVLEGGLVPEGGCWVPDSCRFALVHVPIRGFGRVRVNFTNGVTAPASLVLVHEGETYRPNMEKPTTTLRRDPDAADDSDPSVVTYVGWIRSDVTTSTLLLPYANVAIRLDPKSVSGVFTPWGQAAAAPN